MNIIHRKIDFVQDKDYLLERHCKINYECDTPWMRRKPYSEYRAEWFSQSGQIREFYDYLQETAKDERTIAEILEAEDGSTVGYFWVPFIENKESGFCFADIQDIYIEEAYRKNGFADELIPYAEEKAKKSGARVIRSGTGCENIKSITLHRKHGFYQYRYEFEKELIPEPTVKE